MAYQHWPAKRLPDCRLYFGRFQERRWH
jgi:hypothetical protein